APWVTLSTISVRVLSSVTLADSVEEALAGADGCILQADWPEFARLTAQDFLRTMKTPVVVDGRRILDPAEIKGVRFRRIG
ncbi:MAG: UDP binding domain-containing protein, partial [Dehalococcoidia bacterium]